MLLLKFRTLMDDLISDDGVGSKSWEQSSHTGPTPRLTAPDDLPFSVELEHAGTRRNSVKGLGLM